MTKNIVRRAVVTTALAAGLLAAVAGTAYASPGSPSGTAGPPGMDLPVPVPGPDSGLNGRERMVDPARGRPASVVRWPASVPGTR